MVQWPFWIAQEAVDQWYAEKNVFFIVGLGRSGTHFLSDLLSTAPDTVVYHEPLRQDFHALVDAHASDQLAYRYIAQFRKKRMYLLTRKKNPVTYGEANSNLRYHAQALQQCIPHAIVLHLIRDGRDVVRSLMARGHYTNDGIDHHSLLPRPDDPLYDQWNGFTRFEKLCWLWADSNQRLSQTVKQSVRFEQLVSDYDYFQAHIEGVLGLTIGREHWQQAINRPADRTVNHALPHWRDWDTKLQQSFDRICGNVMQRYQYY